MLKTWPNLYSNEAPPKGAQDGPTHYQLLMSSSNLLKSQSPYMVGEGRGPGCNFQLLTLSPNLLKSQSLYMVGGRGGGGLGSTFQLLMLCPSLLKSQSPYTVWGGGVGWWSGVHLLTLMLSPNLLKPQSSYTVQGGGVGSGVQLPTLDAVSKSAKIPKFLQCGSGGGVEWGSRVHFQLLMLCPNLLKSQSPYTVWEWGWGRMGVQGPTSNFWCWVQIC